MADTTPRLNTTGADPLANYAPVSWMAVASMSIAVLFAAILGLLIFIAYRESKPVIEPWLFGFPALGLVLAFAARRHIVNSENTRSGLPIANRSWWICVVGGLGYIAYLTATEYTIRQDTDKQFSAWAENLKKADLRAANDPGLSAAFYQTLPPPQRNFSASDTTQMQSRFGQEMVTFRQNRLLMLLQRNPERCELVAQGMKQWQQSPGKIECLLAATLKCPEGEFPLVIPMQAIVDKGKREWQIATFDGYFPEVPGQLRTEYGWFVELLEISAKYSGGQFLEASGAKTIVDGDVRFLPDGLLAQPIAYELFSAKKSPGALAGDLNRGAQLLRGKMIVETAHDRTPLTGSLGLFWPTSPEYARAIQGPFFVQTPLPDGRMAPEGTRDDFLQCWNNIGQERIVPGGRILSNSTDKNCLVRFFENRVEVSVPIELKVPKSDPRGSAALGKLVMTLDDPEVMAELARLRELGLKGAKSPAPNFSDQWKQKLEWRVARIESDLKVIRTAPVGGPPGGGPPGGQ